MDDVSLIAGLRGRQREAQEWFWRRYWDVVYPISAHILGAGPDAVDICVDLLLDFMDNRVDTLTNPKGLYAYLRLSAVRRSIRYQQRRALNEPLDPEAFERYDVTPEERAAMMTLMPRLADCLETISPKAQKTLSLKFGSDLTHQAIGGLVGGSKQYISRVVQKSLTLLRACIENKDTVEGEV